MLKTIKKTRLISVVSNKGGVGKTTLSVLIATYFARKIKSKTLLLELDSSPGDFGVIFDIGKDKSLDLVLRKPASYKNYIKNVFEGLDVIRGISDPVIAESFDDSIFLNLLQELRGDYDNIIIDTQTVINGLTVDVLKNSDLIFLVSDCKLESISRVADLVRLFESKFSISTEKIRFLINKKKNIQFFRLWEIAEFLGLPVEAFIKYDSHFSKSFFLLNPLKALRTRMFGSVSRAMDMFFTEEDIVGAKRKNIK